VVLTTVQRAIYCAVCWCVVFREVGGFCVLHCTGTELSGSNMAAQSNFNCLNYKDHTNKLHFPFTRREDIWRNGVLGPHIHTLSTRRMWTVSLTPSNSKVGKGCVLAIEWQAVMAKGPILKILRRAKYAIRIRTPVIHPVLKLLYYPTYTMLLLILGKVA
jgi:hypothetical protein